MTTLGPTIEQALPAAAGSGLRVRARLERALIDLLRDDRASAGVERLAT